MSNFTLKILHCSVMPEDGAYDVETRGRVHSIQGQICSEEQCTVIYGVRAL
jgi:hypothetical protein